MRIDCRRRANAAPRLRSTRGSGANLLSYLLFDRDFCRALLRLGYQDTFARRDEVAAFLDVRRTNLIHSRGLSSAERAALVRVQSAHRC
jgi:hypothetical protein